MTVLGRNLGLNAFLLILISSVSALGGAVANKDAAFARHLRSLQPEERLSVHNLVAEVLALQQVVTAVQQGAEATAALQGRLQAAQQQLHSLLPQLDTTGAGSLQALHLLSTEALLARLVPRPSRWRAFTLVNIAWFIGCILVVVALISLVGIYLVALLMLVPVEAWEVLGWAASAYVLRTSLRCSPQTAPFVALTGLLLLTACIGATIGLHFKQLFRSKDWAPSAAMGLLALVYGALAIRLQASMLGTISVWWAVSALGFSILVFPFLTVIGFRNGMGRSFAASLMLILAFLPFKVAPRALQMWASLRVFDTGVWLWCSLVLNVSNLIMAHQRWDRPTQPTEQELEPAQARTRLSTLARDVSRYGLFQLPAVAVLGGTLAAGILLDIEPCRAVGSVFSFLWFLSKLTEYNWQRVGFAWAALAFGSVLWCSAYAVHTWPQLLMPGWKVAAVVSNSST